VADAGRRRPHPGNRDRRLLRRAGGLAVAWSYRDGASFLNGNAVTRVAVPHDLLRPDPRVAVLTDKRVASSGEAIAVAFRARPKTRTFGTETCGVPTANGGFPLSDNALLQLTTALDADRAMTIYNAPLPPDEQIDDPSGVVQRAIQWIRAGG
jgi:C-terminal processing protease CtpA/Prc